MNILIMDMGAERREKSRHLHNLVAALAERPEAKITLAGREASPLAEIARNKNLGFITCKSGRFGTFVTRLKLAWHLRKSDVPQIVQCFDQDSLALSTKVSVKKRHVHILYAALLATPLTNNRLQEHLSLVKAVIAETREIAGFMAANGFGKSDIFTIPGGIEPAAHLERRERGDGRIIFACSDTLEHGRGYDKLLEALALLRDNNSMPPWEIRIASEGPLFDEFLEKAVQMHIDSRLAIFGGIPAASILRDCDIFIAPANKNGGGNLGIKEGWATGLPAICSDITAHRELAEDGINAIFFRNNDAADLADKMYLLATSRELCARLARAGQSSIGQYGLEPMLRKHLALYRSLLQG